MSKRSDDYTKQINDLVAVFRAATDGTEWVILVEAKVMRDEDEHNVKVPTLTLQKGPTRLYLDPTGYDIPAQRAWQTCTSCRAASPWLHSTVKRTDGRSIRRSHQK